MTQTTCNFETADGSPCQNLIGPGPPQCAAGHPVTNAPLSSPSAAGLTQDQVSAQVAESFDAEDLLGLTPAVSDDEAEAASAAKKLAAEAKHKLERPARRKARAEKARDDLASWANVEPTTLTYLSSPIDGERPSLTKKGQTRNYHLERFNVAAKTPFTLAYGNLSDTKGQWFLESACTTEGCQEHAYSRIRGLGRYIQGGAGSPEKRTAAFAKAVGKALQKSSTAACPDHRTLNDPPILADDDDSDY